MKTTYDRRFFAPLGFLFFLGFLGFLGTENYRHFAALAAPASLASLAVLVLVPRNVDSVPPSIGSTVIAKSFGHYSGKLSGTLASVAGQAAIAFGREGDIP